MAKKSKIVAQKKREKLVAQIRRKARRTQGHHEVPNCLIGRTHGGIA